MQTDNSNIKVLKNFSINHMNPKGGFCKNTGIYRTLAEKKKEKEMCKFSCEDDNSAEFFQEEILLDIIKYII